MQPVIMHIDLNSYFASVEQQDNPQWRGKPLGVCEHLGGILIAASVEAKLYPKIILTKTHPDRYRLYSDRLMKVLADYTAFVEQYSIDEAFLDLTKVSNITHTPTVGLLAVAVDPFLEAARIARVIKMRMKKEVGDFLRCSVGIGENKLIAKIASDLQKPDGLVVVGGGHIQEGRGMIEHNMEARTLLRPPKADFGGQASNKTGQETLFFSKEELYEKLSLTDIPGIGFRQEKRLNALGIFTVKDLRDYPQSKLETHFGIMGRHLHSMGQLESSWKPSVEQEQDIKSIGHMYTLPKEYRQQKFFVPVLYKLSEMVARRMRKQELTGNIIHFHIHDHNQKCYGKSKRLGYYIEDGREIFAESMKIFSDVVGRAHEAQYKLIGVTVAGLIEQTNQLSLFPKDRHNKKVLESLDAINEKYGDFTVCRVPVRLAGKVFHDSIGFGRIKEHVRLASFR